MNDRQYKLVEYIKEVVKDTGYDPVNRIFLTGAMLDDYEVIEKEIKTIKEEHE